MTRLIYLGPPGAGKGTQAKKISNLCHVPHVSTGDTLRTAVAQQTDLGKKAELYMKAGDLVPDELIFGLISERLVGDEAGLGWILDGFPRNVEQASFLDGLLAEIDQKFDCVVNLDVPDEVIVSRLIQRGQQEHRSDDTEATIRHRLDVYRQETEPLIDFYRNRQALVSVNGNQPIEAVTYELIEVLGLKHRGQD